MLWPPFDHKRWKMAEHSAWYSGDPTILANFYNDVLGNNHYGLTYNLNWDSFWGRQIKNENEIGIHVPIAGDVAALSADLLFSEPPIIKIVEAHEENASQSYKYTQEVLNNMLDESCFFRKILECAETCAAMGGGYIKVAWDSEVSEYPIPVIEQVDNAVPFFTFGILTKVIFWKVIKQDDKKVYRLFETYYNNGSIEYDLWLGTCDKLGNKIDLTSIVEGENYKNVETLINSILCVYIPNILPNRLDRNSCMGRSDFLGVEGLMDSLDETFSSWMRDIAISQGKILIPGEYLNKDSSGFRYNLDKMVFAKLDVDPVSDDSKITPIQFDIRADKFEKTCLNLIERIITSAGYSPQSMGLTISGRAESGTALNIRERRSFITKNKKETYWESALKKIIKLMLAVYKTELNGSVEVDVNITTQFSDSLSNDISETSTALQQISAAMAASTETKVRMLHTEWSEDEIMAEVEKIIKENGLSDLQNPDEVGINLNNLIKGDDTDDLD
jgi:A118 family predicted phage portal protein